ncbi:hypothetical protein NP233_g12367 [Leucocoprinus birnbaumii]|uniref:NACHT domain-containing protein n=1 Tax=Leucocoprinus birnbaumii TaxID=56174 RepID=A0AAD5VER0_9AGAR|nr:hypothetical protein NP233_g12367 [Leucocoprinus birnbaumii]
MSWQLLLTFIFAWAAREYYSTQESPRASRRGVDMDITQQQDPPGAHVTPVEYSGGGEKRAVGKGSQLESKAGDTCLLLDGQESTRPARQQISQSKVTLSVDVGTGGGNTDKKDHIDQEMKCTATVQTQLSSSLPEGDPSSGGPDSSRPVAPSVSSDDIQDNTNGDDTTEMTPSERSQVLKQQTIAVSGGFFNNSHDLVFNNSVMYNIQRTTEHVLHWLAGYTLPGAEFDSSLRDPPPRCHPGTRIDIRQMILRWVDNQRRIHRLLWLRGTAGVGKSAIIQTLTEELWSASKLGGAFFFSRPNKLRNPIFVFPTLAYQLAVRLPAYRLYLEERMTEDPNILEKGIERQFHILFSDPFPIISASLTGNYAVFLDGLDECDGTRAQALIVKLIASFALDNPTSPLVWVISSRPEPQIATAFESAELSESVWMYDVPSNGDKASLDVEKYLRENFRKIQSKHDILKHPNASWPVEQDITQICSATSGNYALATTIIRIIDDLEINDPISQLSLVLFTTSIPRKDPLLTLYALYTKVFEAIPKSLLRPIKLVLAYHLASKHLAYDFGSSLVLVATLFGLEQRTIYAGLQKLQSVLEYPSREKSGSEAIRFRHASLSDWLQDESISGEYTISVDMLALGSEVSQGCLRLAQKYAQHPTPWSALEFAWDTGMPRAGIIKRTFWTKVLRTLLSLFLEVPLDDIGIEAHDTTRLSGNNHTLFETLDFSQLTFERSRLLKDLCRLTIQLSENPVHMLIKSGLVEKIAMGDLDLRRIFDKKLAFRAEVAFISSFDNYDQSPDSWVPVPGTENDPLGSYFSESEVQRPTFYAAWWLRHATAFSNGLDEVRCTAMLFPL